MSGMKRGLQILDAVAERGPLPVDGIAEAVGLPLSTTYRYVGTLRSLGYLAATGGRYDVGTAMLGLLRRGSVEAAMGRLASPTLVDLAVQTGEVVLLTVPIGWTATCVESVEPRRPVRLSNRRGVALPLHVGAAAKPLLAHLPGRAVEDYLRFIAPSGLRPGAHGWDSLHRQLAEIRRTGVCVTLGELDPGSIGIGVPVFTEQQLAACVSLAGPRSRFPGRRIREASELLRSAAEAVERAWTGELAEDDRQADPQPGTVTSA
jgi:DNA-binding IclR family transcriptional regulator